MNQQRASDLVEVADDLLSDSAVMSAPMLRDLAVQWRFCLRAGRQGRGTSSRIMRFVNKLEAAEQAIEPTDMPGVMNVGRAIEQLAQYWLALDQKPPEEAVAG